MKLKKGTSKKTPKGKVKVLYQYLNGQWYAFADMGNDIFVGKVPAKGAAIPTGKNKKSETEEAA